MYFFSVTVIFSERLFFPLMVSHARILAEASSLISIIYSAKVKLIQWLVRGLSENESATPLKLSELRNSSFMLNAQEMSIAVPGRLTNLLCHSIASEMGWYWEWERFRIYYIGRIKAEQLIAVQENGHKGVCLGSSSADRPWGSWWAAR